MNAVDLILQQIRELSYSEIHELTQRILDDDSMNTLTLYANFIGHNNQVDALSEALATKGVKV